MQLFYCPNSDPKSQKIILPEQESKHCIRVLRKKQGDKIHIIDGKGGFYEGTVTNENQKHCAVIVNNYEQQKPKSYRVHIAVAPTKNNDRTEWLIEKCVEFGVDEISFVKTFHSERKVLKDERLFKTALSACKQSLKAKIPILNSLQTFNEFLEKPTNAECYIAYVQSGKETHLAKMIVPQKSYCILIGPEGGFSEQEVLKANQKGFQTVSLGENRLRTETAAIASCHILNLFGEQK